MQGDGNPTAPPLRRGPSKPLIVVLVVAAVAGALLFTTCALVGGIALLTPADSPPPPPLVRHAIPPESDYFGTWKSADGVVTLTVSKDTVSWLKEKKSAGSSSKVSLEGNYAGIAPDGSLRMRMLVVSKTLAVSDPPHLDESSGEWRMTIEHAMLVRTTAPTLP